MPPGALSMCCFSSNRLEAALLVKWNVDYLVEAFAVSGKYGRSLGTGMESHEFRGHLHQARCWVLRDRAPRRFILRTGPSFERPAALVRDASGQVPPVP